MNTWRGEILGEVHITALTENPIEDYLNSYWDFALTKEFVYMRDTDEYWVITSNTRNFSKGENMRKLPGNWFIHP